MSTSITGVQKTLSWKDRRSKPLLAGLFATFVGMTMGSSLAATQQQAASLVIDGVTVVDVEQGKLVPDQRVVVAGTRITAVMPRRGAPPPGAQVVDAANKYLIPGLWDMHVHLWLPSVDDPFFSHFIAYGITGIRIMGQQSEGGAAAFVASQRAIGAGTSVGPRGIGPSYDVCYKGPGHQYVNAMPTAEAAHRIIDSLKAAGFAFLKIHGCDISRESYFAIAREARRVGLQFVGHIPMSVTEIEALDSGQVTVEHFGDANHACWPRWPVPLDSLAEQRCARTAAAYRRNHAWLTPTLIAATCAFPSALQDAQQYVGILHRAGVPILAGTDYPGLGDCGEVYPPLHEELVFLVGAGLTPLEALRTATLNPAEYLHATDSLGTIAPGKLANLVLLDADPLADIHHTRQVRAVVANGRYFDSTALAALREDLPPPQTTSMDPEPGVDTQAVYLGYQRAERFVSPEGLRHDTLVTYTAPSPSQLATRGAWGLIGPWRVTSAGATLVGGPGKLVLRFRAPRLSLLLTQVRDSLGLAVDSIPVQFRVRVDGNPPENDDRVSISSDGEKQMYPTPKGQRPPWGASNQFLVSQAGPLHDQTLEIEFLTPVTVFEFTFDPRR